MYHLGESMKSLLQTSVFSSLEEELSNVASMISSAKVVQLMAPADLEGVLALAQLESALLDNSQHYRRRVLAPRRHVSRDHIPDLPEVDGLIIHIDPFHETQSSLESKENYVHIFPLSVSVKFGSSSKEHNGAVECVAICAAIASILAPEGARVRKQRSMAISGSWLRGGADSDYDPVLSLMRDHLDTEGSIDICPLPEVPLPEIDMIPGLSKMMLKRLSKGWPTMDVEQRSSAISELVLPALRMEGISTMRLEELVWHRIMIPGNDVDLASQLHKANLLWPDDLDQAKIHASSILDGLISIGSL